VVVSPRGRARYTRLLPAQACISSPYPAIRKTYISLYARAISARSTIAKAYANAARTILAPKNSKAPECAVMRFLMRIVFGHRSITLWPHTATSRHYGHIPNTQANPQKQAKPSPTLPASNGIVCPPTPTPTANANGDRIKLAGNVLLLLRTGTIYGSLNPCRACVALAGDGFPRLTTARKPRANER